jgi:hypothetical protein
MRTGLHPSVIVETRVGVGATAGELQLNKLPPVVAHCAFVIVAVTMGLPELHADTTVAMTIGSTNQRIRS